MVSYLRKVKIRSFEPDLCNWGKAEVTDKWVILHKQGSPKWAIYYRQKRPAVAIPCQLLRSRRKRLAGKGPRQEVKFQRK